MENQNMGYKFTVLDTINTEWKNIENDANSPQTSYGSSFYFGNDLAVSVPVEIADDDNTFAVDTICSYTFSNKPNLNIVELSHCVKTIQQFSFVACDDLKMVNIPQSVENINAKAFHKCSNLIIYCEIAENEKPKGWKANWNGGAKVVWQSNIFDEIFEQMQKA